MAAHPDEFTDTDPRVMDVWPRLLRGKTPGERMTIAFDLTDFALRMAESSAREVSGCLRARDIAAMCGAPATPPFDDCGLRMGSRERVRPRNSAARRGARIAGTWPLPLKLSVVRSRPSTGLKLLKQSEAPLPVPLEGFREQRPMSIWSSSEVRSDRCPGGGVKFRILYRPRYDPGGVCARSSRKRHSSEDRLEIRFVSLREDEYSRTEFARRVVREIRPYGREAIECAVASATGWIESIFADGRVF